MLKHPPLQLLGQLGQVLSVLLRSHDDAFLGRRSGNLVDFPGDFVLGSVQLRSQTLVLLQEEQEEQEMPFRTSAHGPGMATISGGQVGACARWCGSHMRLLFCSVAARHQHA